MQQEIGAETELGVSESQAIQDNINLIYKFMGRRFCKNLRGYNQDEVFSELLISLWKSVKGYRKEVGAFSTYAMRGMELTFLSLMRSGYRYARFGTEDGLQDASRMEGEVIHEDEIQKMYRIIDDTLLPHERDVVLSVANGKSHAEIARKYKFTRQRSYSLYQKSLGKLNRRMAV